MPPESPHSRGHLSIARQVVSLGKSVDAVPAVLFTLLLRSDDVVAPEDARRTRRTCGGWSPRVCQRAAIGCTLHGIAIPRVRPERTDLPDAPLYDSRAFGFLSTAC